MRPKMSKKLEPKYYFAFPLFGGKPIQKPPKCVPPIWRFSCIIYQLYWVLWSYCKFFWSLKASKMDQVMRPPRPRKLKSWMKGDPLKQSFSNLLHYSLQSKHQQSLLEDVGYRKFHRTLWEKLTFFSDFTIFRLNLNFPPLLNIV